jgi:hypothetical protein
MGAANTGVFRNGLKENRLSKNVAGAANVLLTVAEANHRVLVFTGALTGNIAVTVPVSSEDDGLFWIVYNNTSGSFTLTFTPATGSGVAVPQGQSMLLTHDGTNMVNGIGAPAQTGLRLRDLVEHKLTSAQPMTVGTETAAGQLTVVSAATGTVALVVMPAVASPSASIVSIRNSAGTALFSFGGSSPHLLGTDQTYGFHYGSQVSTQWRFGCALDSTATVAYGARGIAAQTSNFVEFKPVADSAATRFAVGPFVGNGADKHGIYMRGWVDQAANFITCRNSTDTSTLFGVGPTGVLTAATLTGAPSANGNSVTAKAGNAQTAEIFQVTANNNALLFGIEADGDIRTSRTTAATTLGSVAAKLAIYNAAGTLVGYLPIYDNITGP